MGLALLKREVLERMSEVYPELWGQVDAGYRGMRIGERVFQPFESYRTPENLYLGEDISFSRRWTDIGGEIWACVDEQVTHAGMNAISGRYIDTLHLEGRIR
jgi:hypothetical protein